MSSVTLSVPRSGAQGEYAGLCAIMAYHRDRGEQHRKVKIKSISFSVFHHTHVPTPPHAHTYTHHTHPHLTTDTPHTHPHFRIDTPHTHPHLPTDTPYKYSVHPPTCWPQRRQRGGGVYAGHYSTILSKKTNPVLGNDSIWTGRRVPGYSEADVEDVHNS